MLMASSVSAYNVLLQENALQFYASHQARPEWGSTAEFLSLVIKLWNILNVKTSHKGKHKRDYTMDPVRYSLDWKLDFLRDFAAFLEQWETSSKPVSQDSARRLFWLCDIRALP